MAMIESWIALTAGIDPARPCLCEWTIAWAPDVQAVLGWRGGFYPTADALFVGEILFAAPFAFGIALGRWLTAATALAIAAMLPFALFTALFGIDRGQDVLQAGGPTLLMLCGIALVPAFFLGAFARGVWLLFRHTLITAPVDIRI